MGESCANRTGGGPRAQEEAASLCLAVSPSTCGWFMENFGLPELPHKKLSNLSSQSSVCLSVCLPLNKGKQTIHIGN